ncbi:MAG TPA: TolC family protein [Gemmatimonadaceae bacterium]|nr:TolC family protein [Gemmatimonadaceae bacterium]
MISTVSFPRLLRRAWLTAALCALATAAPAPGVAQSVTPPAAATPVVSDTITLDEAIRVALRRNRDVRTASLALEEAGSLVSEAWSGVYPSVDLDASYTRNISPTVSFLPAQIFDPDAGPDDLIRVRFGADNVWASTIRLEQPLFNATVFLALGAAGRFHALQEEMVRGAMQTVVTRVRITYYDVLLAQEQARLLESSVERVRVSLREATAMRKAGVASEYDVLRLEVELANLEPNLRRSHNAVAQARRALAVELATPGLEHSAVAGTLAELDVSALETNTPANRTVLAVSGLPAGSALPTADALVAMAHQERSDIRQLELTRSLRHTEMRVEQLEYAPKIALFANYQINAQQNGAPTFFGSAQERSYGRLAGVSVTMPLFTGFRERARIRQRRAVVRTVEAQAELARDQAEAQVRSLAESAQEAAARADGQRLAVRQAQRGFQIVGAQYREGLSGQLERTDAEVALRQSEFNYAQAVYDYLVARAQLDEATGRTPGVDDVRQITRGGR